MKIIIDGCGGHFCEAFDSDSNLISAAGSSIDEAIGYFIWKNKERLGIEIEILPCSTSAFTRSWQIGKENYDVEGTEKTTETQVERERGTSINS